MPHEWDSPEYVRQWIEDGDKTDPERAEQITALVGLVRCSAEAVSYTHLTLPTIYSV